MANTTIYIDEEIAEQTRRLRDSKEAYLNYNGEPNVDDDPADYFHGNLKGRLIA